MNVENKPHFYLIFPNKTTSVANERYKDNLIYLIRAEVENKVNKVEYLLMTFGATKVVLLL